jgi:hypothetical protein
MGFDEKGEEAEVEWHKEADEAGWEGSLSDGQMGEEERLEREPKKLKRGVEGSGGSGSIKTSRLERRAFCLGRSRFRVCQRKSLRLF